MIGKSSLAACLALGSALTAVTALADFRLINGTEVPAGQHQEVVAITSSGAPCSATIVGPRVILTAAHCAATGTTVTFKVGTKSYSAKVTRSPIYNYPKVDHDMALGLVSEDVTGVEPASISTKQVKEGNPIFLLGYGCVQKPPPGQPPQSDGKLRIGETVVTGFAKFDMVSRRADGAALCFGDSGGPTYMKEASGKYILVGVSSKGNVVDTNWSTRVEMTESQTFLKDFAQQNGVKICGINADCGTVIPPDPAPTCTLTANPGAIKVNEKLTLTLISQGKVTSATINDSPVNSPTGSVSITGTAVGSFTARGRVVGPGGEGVCQTTYIVENGVTPPEKPTCRLTATPDTVKVGENVTLEITTQGNVTSAMIDSFAVTHPVGKRIIQTTQQGTFTSNGVATGPGGTGTCSAVYRVDEGGGPPVEAPNFAVVPTYCGDNALTGSKVSRVCLGVLKKDANAAHVYWSQALIVHYADSSKEVMPFMGRKPRPKTGNGTSKEDVTLYANRAAVGNKYLVLDTRTAVLTTYSEQGTAEIPVAIEGMTAANKGYLVEKLSPYNVTEFLH